MLKEKLALSPGMEHYQRVSEETAVDMSVYLRRKYRLMSEHLLNSPEICSSFYKMGGK